MRHRHAQVGADRFDSLRHDVRRAVPAVDVTGEQDQLIRQRPTTLGEHLRPDDGLYVAGLILDRDEDGAILSARVLPRDRPARNAIVLLQRPPRLRPGTSASRNSFLLRACITRSERYATVVGLFRLQ